MNPLNHLGPVKLPKLPSDRQKSAVNAAIDGGIPVSLFRDLIELSPECISFIKFGWGSGAITRRIDEKVAVLREHGIPFWFGGTLFEIAYQQKDLPRMLDWCEAKGARYFEVSDGSIELPEEEKCQLIQELAQRFQVLSEVGSKDQEKVMTPSEWRRRILNEMEAGSEFVIAEGRESGTAGIYRSSGEVRIGLVEQLREEGVDFSRMLFEAPQKSQQIWFLQALGREVNLGNLALTEILNVECLRLGLRGDTVNFALDA